MPLPRTDSQGFTLLEILIGFAITALMMMVLLRTFTGGLEGSRRSANVVAATLAAQSALDAAGVLIPLRDGTIQDVSEGPFLIHTQVRRRTDLVSADASALYVVPYDVIIRVSWQEGGKERLLSLSSLRLGPHAD